MPRIKYVGPSDAIDIPSAGVVGAKRDEPFEVSAEAAKSLLKQSAFEPAKSTTKEK